jgi:glucosyl-dolichyl phosphate glucuronosyltransferase
MSNESSQARPRITVAICTWNRSHLLARTLQRLTEVQDPRGGWELIVVNNNCSDDTDAVIGRYESRLPLRRIFERQPGLSAARNAAVREARSEYIVWTDDDVLVEPSWLLEYEAAFLEHPSVAVFGGPIEPWFEGSPPRWLERAFPVVAGAYAALDLGSSCTRLDHDHYPFGANMAFRSDALRGKPFDVRLGRTGTELLGGEEMTLIRALFAEGQEGRWVPRARVRHFVPAERQTVNYLRRYYLGAGKGLAFLGSGSVGRTLFGRPLWLWRQALEFELRYWVQRSLSRHEQWVDSLKMASVSWGQLRWFGHRSDQ